MNSLKSFRVGEWRVEPTLNQIFRDSDPEQPVRLEPKAMQVLVHLAERAGEVVGKDSVIRDVWEGAFVTNEVLTNAIWELRRALGDDARSSVFIRRFPSAAIASSHRSRVSPNRPAPFRRNARGGG